MIEDDHKAVLVLPTALGAPHTARYAHVRNCSNAMSLLLLNVIDLGKVCHQLMTHLQTGHPVLIQLQCIGSYLTIFYVFESSLVYINTSQSTGLF